jgi:hypothetical protein
MGVSVIRGRVIKWVTNGRKTAVMEVIGFLCVPLGSRTVQLQAVQVADAHKHVHKVVSLVKMTTVLEEYTAEEQLYVVLSFL